MSQRPALAVVNGHPAPEELVSLPLPSKVARAILGMVADQANGRVTLHFCAGALAEVEEQKKQRLTAEPSTVLGSPAK